MSNKWTLIGTNALEAWGPQTKAATEKARRKAFKQSMKINKMKTNKPKKSFIKKEDQEEVEAGIR